MDILEFIKALPEDECGNRKRILEFLNGNYKPRYYLRVNGEYLETEVMSNPEDADCCGETTTTIKAESKEITNKTWFTYNLLHAATVKYVKQYWYNSDWENPVHYYKPHEIEIVREGGTVMNVKALSDYTLFKMKSIIYNDPKWFERNVEEKDKERYTHTWLFVKNILDEYKSRKRR